MKKCSLTTILTILLACLGSMTATAQPRYDYDNIQRERLNRGVVAVKNGDQVVVSWRILRSDKTAEPFDIYRNGTKLNTAPLTTGGSFFIDEKPLSTDATYEVKGGNINGSYLLKADSPDGHLPIPIDKIPDEMGENGRRVSYSANDCSVGDVDGDGQYEIFVKWDPSNSRDNAHTGITNNTFIDCYRLDGTKLWRIDLGKNIRSGAHYTQFIVYDFDGDGKAEMMVRTADGTIDGMGNILGNASKDWRCTEEGNKYGRILEGPEYITVFEGMTGKALASELYIPQRGRSEDWGDDHANRSDRFLAAVGYLDGIHASGIFCRGYYTRTVIAAWDWDGKTLRQHWVFDTDSPEWHDYAGQGNHNLRIADVDGDGCDEITYGSMCVDHDGRGLYNTGFGHGDAIHLTVFDPTTDKLHVWDCHENRRDGSDFRDAATGKVFFQLPSPMDVGRCMAADIDPTNPGLEMWSSDSKGIRNIKGEIVKPANPDNPELSQRKGRNVGMSTNFGIWWDGDLLRELLDHEQVLKYNWETGKCETIMRFDGRFNNWTKSNPCLSADILGDWREEVLIRNEESTELKLYISPIPSEFRINCLMEDVPYRLGVAAENVAYNQPPETGFYLGPDNTVNPFLK
ncbi:MAG: rhamnogalacturonan lyase [Prevotella sp.]|nr:rhamnogalacturonan lyase [Prevotella sp.]